MFIFSVVHFLCATALPMEPVYKFGTVMPGVFKTKNETPVIAGFGNNAQQARQYAAVLKQHKQSAPAAVRFQDLASRFKISSAEFKVGQGWMLQHKHHSDGRDFISYVVSLEQNWERFKTTLDQILSRFMEGYSAAEISQTAPQSSALFAGNSTGTMTLNYEQLKEQATIDMVDLLQAPFEPLDQYIAREDPKGPDGKPLPATPDRMARLLAGYQAEHARAHTPEGKALTKMTYTLERNLAVLLSSKELALLKKGGIDPSTCANPMLQILRYAVENPNNISLPQFLGRYVGFMPSVLNGQTYNKNRMKETLQNSRGDACFFLFGQNQWAKKIVDDFKQRVSACRSLGELRDYLSRFTTALLNPNLMPQVKRQLENGNQDCSNSLATQQQSPSLQQQIVTSLGSTDSADLTAFKQLTEYTAVLGTLLRATVASRLLLIQALELYLDSPNFIEGVLPATNQRLLK